MSTRSPLLPLALLAAAAGLAGPAAAQTAPAGGSVLKPLSSGLCVGLAARSAANGAQLVQEACDGSAWQAWTPTALAGGLAFVNRATGKCMDVAGVSRASLANVWQWDCLGAGAANQIWDLKDAAGGKTFVSRNSGLCLDVYGGSRDSGVRLIQYACHGNANQIFAVSDLPGTTAGGGTGTGGNGTGTGTGSGGGTAQPGAASLSVSIRVTAASGWFAKDIFVFTRDANGALASQQTLATYDFGSGVPGMNAPTAPVALPAGARWGLGMRVWPNQDKSRRGNPTVYYGDAPGQRVLASSGDCLAGGRTDSWGDSGAPGRHIVYTLTCTQTATGGGTGTGGTGTGGTGTGGGGTGTGGGGTGTGTGTGGTGGTGTGGTGTGTGGTGTATPPPGETPPAEALLLVNRRSGSCLAAPNGAATAGLQLRQQTCTDGAADNWRFVAANGGYQIRSEATGLCAALSAAGGGDGTRLVQQACSAAAQTQLFRLQRLDQWYAIVSVASNRCVSPTGPNENRDVGAEIVQWTCDQADPQRWTLSAAEAPGRWSERIGLPIVPVAVATLPSGKLLMWSANARNAFGTNAGGITYTTTYDPATNRASERLVQTTGHDMFCPGISTLPDGRIIVSGGQSDTRSTFYNPENDTWTAGPRLNIGRGYNGQTTLSTGEALTVGGSWSGARGGKTAEVWSPASGTWRLLSAIGGESIAAPGVEIYRGDNYAWLFPVAGGNVFHAGPSPEMHWMRTSGAGEIRSAGNRADDTFANNGNAVMYAPDRILALGGAANQTDVPGRDGVFTIDISRGFGVAPTVQRRAPMAFPRAFSSTVVLPNGETVTVGGQNFAREFTDDRPVLVPELWSPETATFKRLPAMATPRTYHSWATLMLDGRVAVGGGGLCGTCATNHPDMEILTPPYLLDAAGQPAPRPAILSADTVGRPGAALAVQTDRAVASFALVRMSSATHSLNADQRRVPLAATSQGGTSYSLSLPAQATGQLLPGPWLLFAMDAKGVPSVAKVVRIQ